MNFKTFYESRKITEYKIGPDTFGEEYNKFYSDHIWIKMSPRRFLELAQPISNLSLHDLGSNEFIRRDLQKDDTEIKEEIYLNINKDLYITGHEGRHRSMALIEMGVKWIPVKINFNYKLKTDLEKRKNEIIKAQFVTEQLYNKYSKIKEKNYSDLAKRFPNDIMEIIMPIGFDYIVGTRNFYKTFTLFDPNSYDDQYDDYNIKVDVLFNKTEIIMQYRTNKRNQSNVYEQSEYKDMLKDLEEILNIIVAEHQ